MNMFKSSKAKTVKEYIGLVPEGRKEAIVFLHTFIQKASPKFKPYFSHNMLGYGSFQYKNRKKEVHEWPIVALANQKQYISIYVCSIMNGTYAPEMYKKELGKVSVGKSCISLKKLEDIHLPTLKKVLKLAAKNPGLAL